MVEPFQSDLSNLAGFDSAAIEAENELSGKKLESDAVQYIAPSNMSLQSMLLESDKCSNIQIY